MSEVSRILPDAASALHRRRVSRAELGEYAGPRQDFAAALKIDPGVAGR